LPIRAAVYATPSPPDILAMFNTSLTQHGLLNFFQPEQIEANNLPRTGIDKKTTAEITTYEVKREKFSTPAPSEIRKNPKMEKRLTRGL
jgi:hypothetical protein